MGKGWRGIAACIVVLMFIPGFVGCSGEDSKSSTGPTTSRSITAKEGLAFAREQAQKWQSDAYLISVTGDDWDDKPTDGKLSNELDEGWCYEYYSPSAEKGIEYEVKPSGKVYSIEIDWGDPASMPKVVDWEIDSSQAIALAEADGGSDFRKAHPDVEIGFLLAMFPLSGSGQHPRWSVEYYSEQLGGANICAINAKDGSLIGWEEW